MDKAQSYQDFSQRFQKAQIFSQKKKQKGVILIGLSRAGKSTLACAAAGSEMEFFFNGSSDLSFLQPITEPYKSLVKDTLTSVTEQPNFFPSKFKVNNYAIVDMPGFADSSRFRELINFHYIQTMIRNLQQVRFLMVINMSVRGDTFEIDPLEIQMMESFCDMFPDENLSLPVGIIVNKLEHAPSKELISKVRMSFTAAFEDKNLDKYIRDPIRLRKFFTKIHSDNFHVILRPKYPQGGQNGKNSWRESGNIIRDQMKSICNQNPDKIKFISANKLNAKLNIFKEGDAIGNAKLQKCIVEILNSITKGVQNGYTLYQKTLANLLKTANNNISVQKDIQKDCDSFLKLYKWHDRQININQYDDKQNLWEVRLLNEFGLICRNKASAMKQGNKGAEFQKLMVEVQNILAKLVLLVSKKYPQLKTKMDKFNITMMRFMEQTLFMVNTFCPDSSAKTIKQQGQYPHNQIVNMLETETIPQISNYQNFDKVPALKDLLKHFSQYFINSNIKILLKGGQMTPQIKHELIEALKISKYIYLIATTSQELPEEIDTAINNKIKQIQIYFLLTDVPTKPEKINDTLTQLFIRYGEVTQKDVKFRLAFKVASLLEHQKDGQKKAIGLFLHLQKHQQVLRLLHVIAETNKATAVQWYRQFAEQYSRKKRFNYFEKCIQMAKKYANDNIEELIALEERLVKGSEQMGSVPVMNGTLLKKQSIKQKMGYWCWDRIDDQIRFLRQKIGSETKIKNLKDVVAKDLR